MVNTGHQHRFRAIGAAVAASVLMSVSSRGAEPDPFDIPAHVPPLIRRLEHENSYERLKAVKALKRFGPVAADAAPALIGLVGDRRVSWNYVSETLVAIGKPAVRPLIEAMNREPKRWAQIADTLGQMGADAGAAVPALLVMMADERRCRRIADVLGNIGKPAVRPLMVLMKRRERTGADRARLRYPRDAIQRNAAIRAVGLIGEDAAPATRTLAKALEEPCQRAAALEALGRIGPAARTVLPLVLRELERGDGTVKPSAAWAVGRTGRPTSQAVTALRSALRDSYYIVSVNAAASLIALRRTDASALAVIDRLMRDGDPKKRVAVARALGSHGERSAAGVSVLVKGLRDDNWHVRRASAGALAEIGPAARGAVSALVATLEKGADDENDRVALRAAVDALRMIGPSAVSSADELKDVLRRTRFTVRPDAVRALGAVSPGDADLASMLWEIIEGRSTDEAFLAAQMMADITPKNAHTLAFLRKMIWEGASEVREAGCKGLGKIGGGARVALSELDELCADKDLWVRLAAAEAMKKIRASGGGPAVAVKTRTPAPAPPPVGAGPQTYNRWAVVSPPSLRQTGVPDLLGARLSGVQGIELVERDHIDAVLRELKLELATGALDAGTRLRLGRMLKADALMLLMQSGMGVVAQLTVVVSESRHGARLRREVVPMGVQRPDAVTAQLVEIVRSTRAHYRSGVRQIIGVSHFVSKNLTHDHDGLQFGLARLLAGALMTQPGVAVIEVEEAQALRREHELAGARAAGRVVPLIVEGEYEVTSGADGRETVRLAVAVADAGTTVKRFSRDGITLDDATAYLRGEVRDAVLRLARGANVTTISVDEQFMLLSTRADTFARLGAWEEALGLREAALLLKPRDKRQRSLIVEEYAGMVAAPWQRVPLSEVNVQRRREAERRIARWRVGLGHLEYAIRNEMVSRQRATKLTETTMKAIGGLLVGSWNNALAGKHGTPERSRAARRFSSQTRPRIMRMLSEVEPARREFLSRAYPLSHSLPVEGGESEAAVFKRWVDVLHEHSLTRCDFYNEWLSADDLKSFGDLLVHRHPDTCIPSSRMMSFLSNPASRQRGDSPFTEGDFVAFVDSLARSDNRMTRIYGKIGRFHRAYMKGPRKPRWRGADYRPPETVTPELVREWEELNALIKPNVNRRYWRHMNLDSYHMPSKPVDWTGGVTIPKRTAADTSLGTLRLERVSLRFKNLRGQTSELERLDRYTGMRARGIKTSYDLRQVRLVACDDALDVLYGPGVVFYLRDGSLLEEILVDEDAYYDDVCWDGRNVWVSNRWAGLRVLDRAGKTVARIGSREGLPPCDRGAALLPLATGELLACGSFGEEYRGWCAVVKMSGAAGRVDVFHKARRVPLAGEDLGALAARADMSFYPVWIHRCDTGRPGTTVLIGRRLPKEVWKKRLDTARPLQVELETRRVSVAPFEYRHSFRTSREACFSRDGNVVILDSSRLRRWKPTGRGGAPSYEMSETRPPKGSTTAQLLQLGDRVYAPGTWWYRMDPRTFQLTALSDKRVPHEFSGLRFGVSKRLGIIGWGSRGGLVFQRVHIGGGENSK